MSDAIVSAVPGVAGRAPETVSVPESFDELCALVKARDRRTLIPMGGRTSLELGNAPAGPFEVVDLGGAIEETFDHQVEDMTLVVSATMPLREIRDRLGVRGQWLPLDPPGSETATIGGIIATGLSGPLRTGFGQPRDMLLGATALRADGELVKAGGRVVKNVTGYDLMRLWTGSLGTLGILTSVSLRVFPKRETVDLECPVDSLAEGCNYADTLLRKDIRPQVADLLLRDGSWKLLVRLATESVMAARAAVPGLREVPPDSRYVEYRDLGSDAPLVARFATLPTLVESQVRALHALRPATVLVRPITGSVRATWNRDNLPAPGEAADFAASSRDQLAEIGGSLIFDSMPGEFRGVVGSWGTPSMYTLEIMRRMKQQYDPDGRLNRGRFVGGI